MTTTKFFLFAALLTLPAFSQEKAEEKPAAKAAEKITLEERFEALKSKTDYLAIKNQINQWLLKTEPELVKGVDEKYMKLMSKCGQSEQFDMENILCRPLAPPAAEAPKPAAANPPAARRSTTVRPSAKEAPESKETAKPAEVKQ